MLNLLIPIIIPTSILIFSLFCGILYKGLLYLALIIGILLIRIVSFLFAKKTNIQSNFNCDKLPLTNELPFSNDISNGMYILSFTFFYICLPMFISKNINIGIMSFFIFLIILDFIIKYRLPCNNNIQYFNTLMFGNFLMGSTFGIFISCLMYYSGGQKLLFTSDISSNKIACSRPSQQKFKCSVYKNGEIVGSQSM